MLEGYPLAILHRTFFYNKPTSTQYMFFVIAGISLYLFNNGSHIIHSIISTFAAYAITKLLPGTPVSVALAHIVFLGHLLVGYWFIETAKYDITWTKPMCIMTLRYIGLVMHNNDGPKNGIEKTLNPNAGQNICLYRKHLLQTSAFMPVGADISDICLYCNASNPEFVSSLSANWTDSSLTECKSGYPGFASDALISNIGSLSPGHDEYLPGKLANRAMEIFQDHSTTFFHLLAIYFPAVTGILTGTNMSGDLRDPGKSIPAGTIAAQLTTSFVYFSLAFVFGAAISPELLREEYGLSLNGGMIVAELAWPSKWVLHVGSFFFKFAAALKVTSSAPRLLQGIATKKSILMMFIFATLLQPANACIGLYQNETSFQCWNQQLIPKERVNDGVRDCLMGEDECSGLFCFPEKFISFPGKCFPESQECNCVKQCLNGSDSVNCYEFVIHCKCIYIEKGASQIQCGLEISIKNEQLIFVKILFFATTALALSILIIAASLPYGQNGEPMMRIPFRKLNQTLICVLTAIIPTFISLASAHGVGDYIAVSNSYGWPTTCTYSCFIFSIAENLSFTMTYVLSFKFRKNDSIYYRIMIVLFVFCTSVVNAFSTFLMLWLWMPTCDYVSSIMYTAFVAVGVISGILLCYLAVQCATSYFSMRVSLFNFACHFFTLIYFSVLTLGYFTEENIIARPMLTTNSYVLTFVLVFIYWMFLGMFTIIHLKSDLNITY